MRLLPAIDLRGGRAVQLVGGQPADERVSLADPLAVARLWQDAGFRALHVVDLDAALGTGNNDSVIAALLALDVPVQVGGGVRDDDAVARLVDLGAARVIVGTRAVEDRDWVERAAARWPGRIIVAADARAGAIVTRGWTAASALGAQEFVEGLGALPLAGVLVTDVTREGRMCGIDSTLFRDLVDATAHPLIASGGIGGAEDLRLLEGAGAAAAVLGMALYTSALDPSSIIREYPT